MLKVVLLSVSLMEAEKDVLLKVVNVHQEELVDSALLMAEEEDATFLDAPKEQQEQQISALLTVA